MKITSSDLSAFYDAKGVKGNCSYCGSDDWSVAGGGEVEPGVLDADLKPWMTTVSLFELDATRTGKNLRLIPLTCVNCGNTKFQEATILVEWLKARDA